MKPIRQAAHRPRDQRGVIGLKQQRLRIERWPGAAVLLLIERVGERFGRRGRASRNRYCERC